MATPSRITVKAARGGLALRKPECQGRMSSRDGLVQNLREPPDLFLHCSPEVTGADITYRITCLDLWERPFVLVIGHMMCAILCILSTSSAPVKWRTADQVVRLMGFHHSSVLLFQKGSCFNRVALDFIANSRQCRYQPKIRSHALLLHCILNAHLLPNALHGTLVRSAGVQGHCHASGGASFHQAVGLALSRDHGQRCLLSAGCAGTAEEP